MTLKIYNNLTRKKEAFEPITPSKVRMYVCGITVYDECHLGHARAAIVFDVIYRYLKHIGYDVTYIRNYTDVDDKIIKKANETGRPWQEITERYILSYQEQMKFLGVLTPEKEPKATDHIQDMVGLIQKLIDRGLAYPSGGDVFFEVRKLKGYGKLSHKNINELEAGAGLENREIRLTQPQRGVEGEAPRALPVEGATRAPMIDEKKKDPLDFALWKAAKPGEPKWPSPWGEGRPGWHIECSAMSMKYLGEQFDIHGGGRDLMFPHHENEIAQSEGATGKTPFAKFWIHNGFVNINAEKMSKSLGNFKTIPGILEQWDPEVVRFFLLSAHYASPLDFTDQAMTNARESLLRCYETLQRLKESPIGDDELPATDFDQLIRASMDDDFNTAPVVGAVFDLVREVNRSLDAGRKFTEASRKIFFTGIKKLGGILGFFGSEPPEFLDRQKQRGLKSSILDEPEIKRLIEERKSARLSKNFKRSDEIRQELASKGVVLKDNPDGSTSWEIKTQ